MTATIAPKTLLKHPSFRLFWLASVASTIALQMQIVAVGWQVYQLTHSAFDLGIVGLVQFIPSLFLVFVVGHVADRYDRRRVARISVAVEALAAGILAAGSLGGWLSKEVIFVVVFLIGAGRAFSKPTLSALLPTLVPPTILPRAVAGSASATQVAIIVGPALGGFLYVAGPATVYLSSCALFLLCSLVLAWIPAAQDQPVRQSEPATLRSVFAGLAYIWSKPAMFGAISLDLFAVLLGGATALLPVYAHDILHTNSIGLGFLRSAPAVGALSVALFLAHHPLKGRVGRTMFIAVAIFGAATIVFGLSRTMFLSLPALAILGASDMISVVVRSSFVQLETPDAMRGRVSAVNSVFIGTSNQLGEFESGITAALFGTVPAVLIGGIGTLLVIGLWMRLFPQLYQIERLDAPLKRG
ncbi:MFS family permease [Herbaspirillum sp. Sphag1AN]|uniref:MFS transporter n=1 Tax=unclassified Herbaspirillum TaxID=2624150 RepID=UPI0016115CD7|nr:MULTISPECIES: MFS transporter [unclassified Herbaspirillum]MBB3213101.1 MFS family permease [Herbaspirillum sp. Sphag1AN]MBB3246298.1 MFS family permease [Herbaspirillum sp. Sphag64]